MMPNTLPTQKKHIDLHPSVDPSGYNDMYFLVPLSMVLTEHMMLANSTGKGGKGLGLQISSPFGRKIVGFV